MPRALVVVAHPDDETVCLGARLGRFGKAHFIYVTDGAPRNEEDSRVHGFETLDGYRMARAQELDRAFRYAGISSATRESLGIPDQEASRRLVELTGDVLARLRRYQPEVVFTHPFEGGHPDHDACAFAVHHAVRIAGEQVRPVVIEGGFYHAHDGTMETGTFVPHAARPLEISYELTAREQQRKRELIACFRTQQQTLSGFGVRYERFRIAPEYDFQMPPHEGTVLYDRHRWGMTQAHFARLTAQAEAQLDNAVAERCTEMRAGGVVL
jgi:LmbE family N-acetylglucosaminyl deacetylase